MTVVNTVTGEIVERLTQPEAERLTMRISLKLDAMADAYSGVMPLIREAIHREAYSALGYRSVGEYVSDRFGGALGKLGIDVRREVVHELTTAGMSTRAIAPVLGVDHTTVSRDAARVASAPPADITEAEFAEATADVEPQEFEAALSAAREDDDLSRTNVVHHLTPEREVASSPAAPLTPVTGIDGKTYSRPAPKPQRSPEQVNAEENSLTLARSLLFLLAFQNPDMRDHARIEWEVGREAVAPTNREFVTPNHMRSVAAGLTALADEWESSHE